MATFAPNLNGTNVYGAPQPPKKQLNEAQVAIRDYCLAEGGTNQDESTVLLHVSHSNLKKHFFQEIRLNKHTKIVDVKQKLEFHTGTSAQSCQIYLLDEAGNTLAECEDQRKLGYYSPYDGCRLHIVDLDPNSASAGGWLEDVSLVKKYEISEEAYNARENTYRNFKAKKRQEDPNWTLKSEMEKKAGKEAVEQAFPSKGAPKVEDEEYLAEKAAGIAVGSRCEVAGGGGGRSCLWARCQSCRWGGGWGSSTTSRWGRTTGRSRA